MRGSSPRMTISCARQRWKKLQNGERCPHSRCKRHSRTVSPQVSRVPMADMAERFMSTRPRFSACVLDATPFEPVSHAASGCSYLMKSWVLMGPLLTPGAAVS